MRLAAIAVLSAGFAGLFGTASVAGDWIEDGGNCVSYVRDVTGVNLQGNAGAWWAMAEGRYARGHEPAVGAILVFRPSGAMPSGHVAIVSHVISRREIQLDQANWIRGRIAKNMWAVDVSPGNDWSMVEVENLGTGTYGRDNPTFGFVYLTPPRPRLDQLQTASVRQSYPVAGYQAVRLAVPVVRYEETQAEAARAPVAASVRRAVYVVEEKRPTSAARPIPPRPAASAKTDRGHAAAVHRAAAKPHAEARREAAKHETAKHEAAAHPAVKAAAHHPTPAKKPAAKTILAIHRVSERVD